MPPPNASLLQVFPPRLNLLIIRSLPIFSLARVPKIPFRCSSSSISPNPPHQSNSSSSSSSSTSTSTPETQDKKKEVGRSGALSASPPAAGPGENQTAAIIDVNPPRGTRDFPPDDMRLRTWLFHNFREVARLFAFEEVDFPVLESEALFIRKAGEEITEQLYSFEDKGGRRVALRPELTPSLARLVIQKGKSVSLPLKWFAIGQCWRYERTTRGRRREHYQWNMDIIGVPGVAAEAELIFSIVTLFKQLGLTASDVGFKVSSRKVLQAVLQCYSIPENLFGEVCVIIDKMEKIPLSEIEKKLTSIGISLEAIKGLVQVLSLKSLPQLEELLGAAGDAVADLKQLFILAEQYGYSQWIHFDASVVRGLAYYTGIVFEGFDRQGNLRAICGGGRYDKLLSTFGGDDIPACGFGFGDAVIIELLKDKGLLPMLTHTVDDIVFPLDLELQSPAAMVASTLRRKGRSVDLVLENKRLKWVFKHAERINASRLILVGDSEWQRGMVRVKNLSTREEQDLEVDEL